MWNEKIFVDFLHMKKNFDQWNFFRKQKMQKIKILHLSSLSFLPIKVEIEITDTLKSTTEKNQANNTLNWWWIENKIFFGLKKKVKKVK